MPTPRPTYLPGHYYHIYNRGAHQKSIFKEPANYLFVQKKIKQYIQLFKLTVIAYCLMPNHYHFLIRQEGEFNAGLLPQRVFNSYTKAYNKWYDHSGTLFEGNYRVKTIQNSSYLMHLCRYIHGNPVKDGFVCDPADWIYSNYLEFTGQRTGTLYDPEFVKDNFGDAASYRNFVLEDLSFRNLPDEIGRYIKSLDD